MDKLNDILKKTALNIELIDEPIDTSQLYEMLKKHITNENREYIELIMLYFSLGKHQHTKYRPVSP